MNLYTPALYHNIFIQSYWFPGFPGDRRYSWLPTRGHLSGVGEVRLHWWISLYTCNNEFRGSNFIGHMSCSGSQIWGVVPIHHRWRSWNLPRPRCGAGSRTHFHCDVDRNPQSRSWSGRLVSGKYSDDVETRCRRLLYPTNGGLPPNNTLKYNRTVKRGVLMKKPFDLNLI